MPDSVVLRALQPHRAGGFRREPGEEYTLPSRSSALGLVKASLAEEVRAVPALDWHGAPGRELRDGTLDETPSWGRLVACLSIWNDRAALERTLPSWYDAVDALVVLDGAYASVPGGAPRSSDGLAEFLGALDPAGEKITLYHHHQCLWPDQNAKRTALLASASIAAGFAGLLLVVDADESIEEAEQLRALPPADAGWLAVSSPLYRRPQSQPRLIRARADLAYRGRHHWLYAGDRLLATHQYGGAGFEHRLSQARLHNHRGLGHSSARAEQKRAHLVAQSEREQRATTGAVASDYATGKRETLRVLQLGRIDAGLVACRLHDAINTTTPHASILGRGATGNPFGAPTQYDLARDRWALARALEAADVVHCHLDYKPLDELAREAGVRLDGKVVVIHHHGTLFRSHPYYWRQADRRRSHLRLVSNLELLSYDEDLHFLPNPVPVARYRRLRAALAEPRQGRPFRIAHSPSKRANKGTEAFLSACERARSLGVAVEPVLLEGMPHRNVLREKARCDAAFDSFWLGLQCSGLEAAAMGLPVIAGDATVVARYREWLGEVPYTVADDEEALLEAIVALATSSDYAAQEAARVTRYVEDLHDEARVALRYLDLLDAACGWRAGTIRARRLPHVSVPPVPARPAPALPAVPEPAMPVAPGIHLPLTREEARELWPS